MAESTPRARPPPNRRRDKAQLSCDPCRSRKLKCDRQHPCGGCFRRGHITACTYAKGSSSASLDTPQQAASQQTTNLHDRISELESLVVTLIKGQSLPSPSSSNSPRPSTVSLVDTPQSSQRLNEFQMGASPPTDPGTLKLSESGTNYVQSIHWEAILTKIRGLKEDQVHEIEAPLGSHLFYGPNRHASREEILAAVPPRADVDRLVAFLFDSYFVVPYLIHGKKFLREYEAFWKDPYSVPVAWVGLLFSMLCIASQLQGFMIDLADERSGSTKKEYLNMKDVFRERAVQALILARYTVGGPYILETLILILTGEFILLKDGASDGWLFVSQILHIAIRMGYHRDPTHFPRISLFEGEMRRRIWTTILQLDLSLSLEMGLPRNAKDTHIDTKEPCNLYDYDFDEDTSKMPQPRPESEWTPVLPLIARARLISALGLICDINTDINVPSCQEVKRIDAILHDVHNSAIPPLLRWETMPHPITDSPNLVVQRVSVETTFHKARILLYRRALIKHQTQSMTEPENDSVRVCLESALRVLSFQQMLYEESQPFGRLSQLKWKVTHIFNQDVLLATSVLCVYLQDNAKTGPTVAADQQTNLLSSEKIREQLKISHKIWLQMSASSAEAGKVAKALSIVLGMTPVPIDDASEASSYDFLTSFDTMQLNGFASMFDHQHVPSGFHSSLKFFDNVLETWDCRDNADD